MRARRPLRRRQNSLLRVVAGLEELAEGRVAFRDRTWQGPDETFVDPWDREVAWLPQDALVFPHLDAEANLRWAEPPESDFADVVEAFEIGDRLDASASALSGGEAQRVAIGRAVLADPELLSLDEPFSALDRRLTERTSEFLDAWCEERGAGLVVAAHHESTVDDVVTSTFRIRQGRVVD